MRPFIPNQLLGNDVVQDFASWAGITLDNIKTVKTNVSYGAEAVSLLYNINSHEKLNNVLTSNPQSRVLLREHTRRFGQTRIHLSPELVKPILDENRSDLEWISSKLGMNLIDIPVDAPFQINDFNEFSTIASHQFHKMLESITELSVSTHLSKQTVALATLLLESILAETQKA